MTLCSLSTTLENDKKAISHTKCNNNHETHVSLPILSSDEGGNTL